MKVTQLLVLSLFVGSITAHPEGIFDRGTACVEDAIRQKSNLGADLWKTFKPGDEEILEVMVPEKSLATIHVPFYGKVDITALDAAKYTALATHLALSVKEELKKHNKISKDIAVRRVGTRFIKHLIVDKAIDTCMDAVVEKLPESVQDLRKNRFARYATNKVAGAAVFTGLKFAFAK